MLHVGNEVVQLKMLTDAPSLSTYPSSLFSPHLALSVPPSALHSISSHALHLAMYKSLSAIA